MEKVLGKHSELIYGVLRIVVGFMFACHGAQKMLGVLGGNQPPFGSQLWVGGVIELVGGGLIALGVFTSYAAFICSGMMAVAYFQFHMFGSNPSIWPVVNRGETAVLYSFVFLLIAARGSGPLALSGSGGSRE